MNTIQKIKRMREISALSKVQQVRRRDAERRLVWLRRESETLLKSIPKKDCALYAEKIARYICAS